MKHIFLSLTSTLLLMVCATSCGPGGGKELSDYPNASTGDSMMYYYAQLRAHEYWKAAMNDTLLRDPEQRRLYIEGVKAGINAIKMNKKYDTYNRGVRRGATMAIRFLFFEDTYGIDLNENILIESLTYGLESEEKNTVSEFQYQNDFYRLYDRVKAQHRQQNEELNKMTLKEEAKKLNLKEISPNLYYRITKKGEGPYPHRGDAIFLDVTYEKADGTNLGIPSPERLTIGSPGMPEVMELAYLHLNKGASGIFATTAEAVFGQRSEIIGLHPDEVLIIKISVSDIVDDQGGTPFFDEHSM